MGEVCTIDQVGIFGGFACFTLVEYPASPRFLGKLFKPLITQQDDLAAHFNQFLTTDHRERV